MSCIRCKPTVSGARMCCCTGWHSLGMAVLPVTFVFFFQTLKSRTLCKRRPLLSERGVIRVLCLLCGIFHIFCRHINILQNFFTALHIVHPWNLPYASPSVKKAAVSSPVAGRWVIFIGNNIRGIKGFSGYFLLRYGYLPSGVQTVSPT